MPSTNPLLDNRSLPDVQTQLRNLAAVALPQWTPPAQGDAGTLLQLIFARMLELTLIRLNRVPEKTLLAFLSSLGVDLLPPSPAQGPLTFTLKSGILPTLIPAGSQASATAGGSVLVFETDDDLTVLPTSLSQAFTMDPTWDRYGDRTGLIAAGESTGFAPFCWWRRYSSHSVSSGMTCCWILRGR